MDTNKHPIVDDSIEEAELDIMDTAKAKVDSQRSHGKHVGSGRPLSASMASASHQGSVAIAATAPRPRPQSAHKASLSASQAVQFNYQYNRKLVSLTALPTNNLLANLLANQVDVVRNADFAISNAVEGGGIKSGQPLGHLFEDECSTDTPGSAARGVSPLRPTTKQAPQLPSQITYPPAPKTSAAIETHYVPTLQSSQNNQSNGTESRANPVQAYFESLEGKYLPPGSRNRPQSGSGLKRTVMLTSNVSTGAGNDDRYIDNNPLLKPLYQSHSQDRKLRPGSAPATKLIRK